MLAQVKAGVGRQSLDDYTAAFFAPDVAAHCYTALTVRVQLPATVETVGVPASVVVSTCIVAWDDVAPRSAPSAGREYASGHAAKTVNLLWK